MLVNNNIRMKCTCKMFQVFNHKSNNMSIKLFLFSLIVIIKKKLYFVINILFVEEVLYFFI